MKCIILKLKIQFLRFLSSNNLHNICTVLSKQVSHIILTALYIGKGMSSSILASSALVDHAIKCMLYKISWHIFALSYCCHKKSLNNGDWQLWFTCTLNLSTDLSPPPPPPLSKKNLTFLSLES